MPLPPGPASASIIGAIRFARNPYLHMSRCAALYGIPFTWIMRRGKRLVFFASPTANKTILSDAGEHLVNGDIAIRN